MGTVVVVWHGDTVEIEALLVAIGHNCGCNEKQPGACPAHQAMLDQRWLNGLLFARWMRERLLAEEQR
jgi:hypothetical protein